MNGGGAWLFLAMKSRATPKNITRGAMIVGRGNSCVYGKYETLFYVDYDNFTTYILDDDGNETTEWDYDAGCEDAEISIEELKKSIKNKTNMTECDYWIGRDAHAILENRLFIIAIEDNQWSYAVKLLQKDNVNLGLLKKHFSEYENILKQSLFEQFETLGVYGGAWTSGKINKNDYKGDRYE